MDAQDSQRRYWMELWDASFEVVRRRLTENDGEVGLSVLESILQPVGKPRATKACEAKSSLDFAATRSCHTELRGGEGPD